MDFRFKFVIISDHVALENSGFLLYMNLFLAGNLRNFKVFADMSETNPASLKG